MKFLLTLLFCMIFINSTSAQNQTNDMRYKKYAGRYGNTSGIGLFEDGTFLLYGYATAVFGLYHFEKDYLLFYPDQQELFQVFANNNPGLGDSTRINFIGFDRGNTYAQFDKGSILKVFNDDANCFDAPFVSQKAGQTKNFILSSLPRESEKPSMATKSAWHYHNESGYNDFIFVHNAPKREYENFSAMLCPTESGEVLKLSNYGGDNGYRKHKPTEEKDKNWEEILEWKRQYDNSKKETQDLIYANKHYNTFPIPDSSQYHYDSKLNQYTNTSDQDNDAYYRENQYNDSRYLRKYIKLQPETKDSFKLSGSNLANKSIFFTVCGEGSEHSYHYNGFEKTKDEDQEPAKTIEPVKIN